MAVWTRLTSYPSSLLFTSSYQRDIKELRLWILVWSELWHSAFIYWEGSIGTQYLWLLFNLLICKARTIIIKSSKKYYENQRDSLTKVFHINKNMHHYCWCQLQKMSTITIAISATILLSTAITNPSSWAWSWAKPTQIVHGDNHLLQLGIQINDCLKAESLIKQLHKCPERLYSLHFEVI